MSGYLDIIFLLILVLVIFSKLRNVLGTNTEETKVVMLSKEQFEKVYNEIKNNAVKPTDDVVDVNSLSPLDRELTKIPNFNKGMFIKGAQKAFEMILSSFSKGDSKTLSKLVSKDLLKKFDSVIQERQDNGITSEMDLIGFVETEVESVCFVENNKVNLVVKFVSEQVNLLKNAEGEVIEGDENYIQQISDIWTFEKSLDAKVNNWVLCSTKKC
ncbi:MAG: Tim44 domain-containing protein [Alphaproteobacteria bacterium]|nr:Tim44 domain-containing protein [Alphaproteobacteria bacterium]